MRFERPHHGLADSCRALVREFEGRGDWITQAP